MNVTVNKKRRKKNPESNIYCCKKSENKIFGNWKSETDYRFQATGPSSSCRKTRKMTGSWTTDTG